MHSNIFTNRTTYLGAYSVLIPKDLVGSLLVGWLVEIMNPDVTPRGISLDAMRINNKRRKKY
jgi:hypothetical protein